MLKSTTQFVYVIILTPSEKSDITNIISSRKLKDSTFNILYEKYKESRPDDVVFVFKPSDTFFQTN